MQQTLRPTGINKNPSFIFSLSSSSSSINRTHHGSVSSDPVHNRSNFSERPTLCFGWLLGNSTTKGAINAIAWLSYFLSTDLRLIASSGGSLRSWVPSSQEVVNSAGGPGCWRRHIPDPFAEHLVLWGLGKTMACQHTFYSTVVFVCSVYDPSYKYRVNDMLYKSCMKCCFIIAIVP